MTAIAPAVAARDHRVRRREWLHVLRTAARTRRGMIGLSLTLFVVGVAVVGPFVKPHSSTDFITGPFAKPGGEAALGGDVLGRDVLSRVLDGGWKLLLMAVLATALGIALGAVAGVSAAYLRGWRDGAIMRIVDVFLAFPQLVFALLLVSIIGPKTWLLVVAVGLSHAPQVARVLRATALEVSERDFVKAVEITGVSRTRIMRTEILPNLITPLMVEAGLRLTYSIIIIAGLSFIGFGIQPPGANWGLMINENRIGLTENYWAVVAPAALIALLTVGVNTLTDAIARVALGVERAEVVMATEAAPGAEVTII
jgi:peptide/nickel transport system permease protein